MKKVTENIGAEMWVAAAVALTGRVLGLWNWLVGGLWKSLELWANNALEKPQAEFNRPL